MFLIHETLRDGYLDFGSILPTCLCYLNNSIFSSNTDMLLTSVSISAASGAMCPKKKNQCGKSYYGSAS